MLVSDQTVEPTRSAYLGFVRWVWGEAVFSTMALGIVYARAGAVIDYGSAQRERTRIEELTPNIGGLFSD